VLCNQKEVCNVVDSDLRNLMFSSLEGGFVESQKVGWKSAQKPRMGVMRFMHWLTLFGKGCPTLYCEFDHIGVCCAVIYRYSSFYEWFDRVS
jgi:hypothetical protein